MSPIIRKQIDDEIKSLKKELTDLSIQLEIENFDRNEEEFAVSQTLTDKKELIEKKIYRLRRALKSRNGNLGKNFVLSNSGHTKRVSIVSPPFANPQKGMISYESPLGKALARKHTGDRFTLDSPRGHTEYVVKQISA